VKVTGPAMTLHSADTSQEAVSFLVDGEMVSVHHHFTRGLMSLKAEIIERYSQILIRSKVVMILIDRSFCNTVMK
jgi:hypothetical protein